MKKRFCILLALMLAAVYLFSGCSETTLVKFNVPQTADAEIGMPYVFGRVTATDSDGQVHQAEVTVVDAQGNPVDVSGNEFKVTSMDGYTITYTVNYGKGGKLTETKTTTVSVFDLTDPEILHTEGLGEDTYAPEGGKVDISLLSTRDNSGETPALTITVLHNGAEVPVSGNTLELAENGTYEITASAEDSSGNSAKRTFNFHVGPALDAESGVALQDLEDWFTCQISSDFARSGKNSYKINLFGLQANWFRDKGVFGQVQTMAEEDYKYLTYWVYFDLAEADLNAAVVWKETEKAERYDFQLFDEFGSALLPAQNTDHTNTELVKGTEGRWIRVVVNAENKFNNSTGAAIPGTGFVHLGDYEAYLGVWDYDANDGAGGEATVAIPTYFDDIQLVKDDAALTELLATGWSAAPDRDAHIIADYETALDIGAYEGCQASRDTDTVHGGTHSLKLSGWGEQGWITANKLFNPGKGGSGIRMWVYVPTFAGTSAEETVPLLKAKSGESFLAVTAVSKALENGSTQNVGPRSNAQGSYAELSFDNWYCVDIALGGNRTAADLNLVFEFWSPTFTTFTQPYVAYIDDVSYVTAATPKTNQSSQNKPATSTADTKAPDISSHVELDNQSFSTDSAYLNPDLFIVTDDRDGKVTPVITVAKDDGTSFELTTETQLEPGKYEITVAATDKAGNKATKTYKITVTPSTTPGGDGGSTGEGDNTGDGGTTDTEAPVITCTQGDLNGMNFPTNQPLDASIFTVADNVDQDLTPTVTVKKDGADFSFEGYAELPDGSYEITVNATDAAGNKAEPLVINITVGTVTSPPSTETDTEAPVLSCTAGDLSGKTFPEKQELDPAMFTATDNVDTTVTPVVTVTKDGGTPTVISGKVNLETGRYEITVTAKDAAGNEATPLVFTNITVGTPTTEPETKDTTPPVIFCSVEGLNGAKYPAGVTLSKEYFSAKDTVDGPITPVISVTKNGASFAFNGSAQLTEAGIYVITVTATDAAGNNATQSYTVTIDIQAPVISCTYDGLYDGATFPAGTYFTTAIFSATDDTDGDITPVVTVSKDGGAASVFSGDTNLEAGKYTITVTAKDTVGNEATPLVFTNITVGTPTTEPETNDTTPPVISCDVENLDGMSFAKGQWLAASIFHARDDVDGAITPAVSVTKNGEAFPFSGYAELTEAGTYVITVTAADAAGNETRETYTVTIVANTPSDTTAPVISCSFTGLNGASFTAGTVALNANIFSAEDDVDGAITPAVSVTKNGEAFPFSGYAELTETGTYVITVTATNAAGITATETYTVYITE